MIIIAQKVETRDRGRIQTEPILLGIESRIFKGTRLRKSSYSWLRADSLEIQGEEKDGD